MFKTYIPRDGYLEKVKPFIKKDIIKVFSGQRRVGKSFLMFQLMDEIKRLYPNANIIYINKELHEFKQIQTDSDLLKFVANKLDKTEENFLFIDEIQDITEFERALRNLLAEGICDIYCTGSNARMLSGDLATYLSGRYIEIRVSGLSYKEFLRFHNLETGNNSLFKFIRYGGLPYLRNLSLKDEVVFEYLQNIYNTILFKDVVIRHGLRNFFLLENLVLFLTGNLGSVVSAKRISDFLKSQRVSVSPKMIIQYLIYLEEAYFIYKVRRADVQGRKIFEIGEKYYFEDLGLRNTICGFEKSDINKVLENLIYLHLFRSGYRIFVGKSETKEIDFIAHRPDKIIYIQAAYMITDKKTHDREFGNLLEIPDNHRKIVVTMDELIEGDFKGVEHKHIIDFLMEDL